MISPSHCYPEIFQEISAPLLLSWARLFPNFFHNENSFNFPITQAGHPPFIAALEISIERSRALTRASVPAEALFDSWAKLLIIWEISAKIYVNRPEKVIFLSILKLYKDFTNYVSSELDEPR